MGGESDDLAPAVLPPVRGVDDEVALIKAARAGSREAAETIASRYWPDAYRAAHLILRDSQAAEDVAQEALLSALGNLPKFKSRRPFGPWLHKIAVNRALDWQRSYRRRAELQAVDEVPTSQTEPLSPELQAALDNLGAEDRAIVVLRHLWNYRANEIGRMLGMKSSTVRTRLQRSLQQLRLALPSEEDS